MAWIWIISISLATLLYILQQLLNLKNNKKLPPGPIGLPILGHFHLLGKNPHQDLYRLAKKHGPIMYTRLGAIPTIVVSSPGAAELFLKTHDIVFCDRPYLSAAYYLGYEQRNLVLGHYNSYWRNMRKLCNIELFSNNKINQFRPTREIELKLLVNSIKQASERHESVDLSVKVTTLTGDITCLMVFGKKYEDKDLDEKGFKTVMKETMEEAGAFHIGDYFPYLRGAEFLGSIRRLKNLSKIFDGFLEKIIDDHVQNKQEKEHTRDFVDTLMSILESGEAGFEFDRRHVKALLLDMLLAGLDTSASLVEWALSEIIRHPTVMNKLQKELERVVGINQMVEESHLDNLEYLDFVIKEAFRLHPPGPLLIHSSMEDCVVDGFHIPKDSRVLVNVWAIGRDPKAWVDPEKFSPERFVGSNVDLRGHDCQLIPFGAGRRKCPGVQIGLTVVKLMVAQLVHCFDWELPDGMSTSDLDMTENFGLVIGRANHLVAIPTYRQITLLRKVLRLGFGFETFKSSIGSIFARRFGLVQCFPLSSLPNRRNFVIILLKGSEI